MEVEASVKESVTSTIQKHSNALETVVAALFSKLKAGQPTDTSASELHILAQEQGQDSKELLGCALSRAIISALKLNVEGSTQATNDLTDALAIVDLSIALLKLRHVDGKLPCTLLEYLLSSCTRQQLSSDIGTIRNHFANYRAASPSAKFSPFIVKAVMSCINRDQKGSDAAISGRLRLMLAASLPVWHPSGMNKRAQVNQREEIDIEGALKGLDNPNLDVALYKAFWNVQKYMRNPTLVETPSVWELARKDMETVLSAFETLECPAASSISRDSAYPGYMTSPSILRLQIVDIRVRRHVLAQFTIFLQHLQAVGETIRTEKDRGAVVTKLNFCKSLFEADGEGEQMRIRVFKQLEKDSAGKFKKFISSILQRERRWIEWKKRLGFNHLNETGREAPKELKRRLVLTPLPGAQGTVPKRRRVSGDTPDWINRQSSWKVPPPAERMAPLVDPDRSSMPTVDVLKEQLREDMDDADVTEDFKRKNDTKYAWRSLRMLCDESLESLVDVIDANSKGGYDLERFVKEKDASDTPEAEKIEPVAAK